MSKNNRHSGRIEVVAGICHQNDTVLLARRALGSQAGRWEFPGGKVNRGETFREAMERELGEELGAKFEIRERFLSVDFEVGSVEMRLNSYFVETEQKEFDLKDHSEVRWVKLKDLEKFDLLEADVPIARALAAGIQPTEAL